MRSLKEKGKTLVDKSPSTIGEPYVHLKLFCVCCKRKFFEGDVREDPDKITGKEKPLCPNCAEHGKLREKLFEAERLELKQKLQQLFKEFPDINSKDYALHNGWNHDLRDRYGLFIADVYTWKKKFEEWLKEEKEAQPKGEFKNEEM
jgi:hypothetical protein